jgi:hypothetical protein
MPYPSSLTAQLIQINGNSCGTISGILQFDDEAPSPEYYLTEGDFSYARIWQDDIGGGQKTWYMKLYYQGVGSPCFGLYTFRLSEDADNPVGDYCRWTGSAINCSTGQASAVVTP